MTLAMIAQGLHAGHAVAIAGRLAAPVLPAPAKGASLLLVHDRDDQVMPSTFADDAATRLGAAGLHVMLQHTSGVGHGIGGSTNAAILEWLAAISPYPIPTLTEG